MLRGSGYWLNEDLVKSQEALDFRARQLFKEGKIRKNWTYLGSIYVILNDTEVPRKVTIVEDFIKLMAPGLY